MLEVSIWNVLNPRMDKHLLWGNDIMKKYAFKGQKKKYTLQQIVQKALSQKRGDSSGITIYKQGKITKQDRNVTKQYPYIFIHSQDGTESTMWQGSTEQFFERNFPAVLQGTPQQFTELSLSQLDRLAKKQQTELMPPGQMPQRKLTKKQQTVANVHINELSDRVAEKIVEVYAVVQKQGIPKKQLSVVKRDIQQFIKDRVSLEDMDGDFITYITGLAKAYFNEHGVTQQADQAYKKVLMNTRTKGKTIEGIYTSLLDNKIIFLREIKYQEPANSAFERLLVDGFIFLILQHPNTPRNVVSAIQDRLRTFIKTRKKYESHLVPYLQDVLVLRALGRKGVADLIKIVLKKDADHMYMLASLIRNPMITGDEITKVFNAASKSVFMKQWIRHIEPVFLEIARNGKTAKAVRDKMMGIELGIDCNMDESMNIRMALASNPNLPKRDLQILEKDPCISVSLVAHKYLKKRFKK